jgi:cysteine desulfurase
MQELVGNLARLRAMRDRLCEGLLSELGAKTARLNGHPHRRLPNTVNLSFRGIEANRLLSEIADQVAASAGAACHADNVEISSVLEAMGVPIEWAVGTVRLSIGRGTTVEEVDQAVEIVANAVRRLGRQ